jgi:hypothetical protein
MGARLFKKAPKAQGEVFSLLRTLECDSRFTHIRNLKTLFYCYYVLRFQYGLPREVVSLIVDEIRKVIERWPKSLHEPLRVNLLGGSVDCRSFFAILFSILDHGTGKTALGKMLNWNETSAYGEGYWCRNMRVDNQVILTTVQLSE